MRTTRALAVSATALAALGLAAPSAAARDGFDHPSNIVATPSVVAPGGQLTVTVDGCPKGGTMTSPAFPQTRLEPIKRHHDMHRDDDDMSRGSDTARGVATIHRDARPGGHHITVNCDGKTLTKDNAFTVMGAAQGGIGGSSSSGATPTDMAIGGGLMGLAVVGGAVFWMRRRSEINA
jgi:MYXO-CTERM domain-containing protein